MLLSLLGAWPSGVSRAKNLYRGSCSLMSRRRLTHALALRENPIFVSHRLSIELDYLAALNVTFVKWARDGEMSAEETGMCLLAGRGQYDEGTLERQACRALRKVL
jgi:hypothetical protein